MGKATSRNWAIGRWLIESMDEWDRDFIDEEVRGYFEFDARGSGSFQFGYVQGQIDYRIGERDAKPAIEFTWDGHDEMDPAQGRGWLVLEGDELKGMLFIHHRDESGIVLKKRARKEAASPPDTEVMACPYRPPAASRGEGIANLQPQPWLRRLSQAVPSNGWATPPSPTCRETVGQGSNPQPRP